MVKQCLKSVILMLKYARAETFLKLVQLLVTAVLTPFSIYFTQRLIDSATTSLNGTGNMITVAMWAGLLIFSMFFAATGGYFDGALFIRMNRSLNKHLTPVIVEKFRKLEYSCFEDRDVYDTINRMSSAPQEKLLNIFLNTTGVITIFASIIGTMMIFIQVSMWFAVVYIFLLLMMTWFNYKAMDMMNTMFNNQSIEERRLNYLSSLLCDRDALFELKIFNAISYISSKWKRKAKLVLDERLRVTVKSQKYFALSTISFKTWSFFIVLYLIHAIMEGRVTIGAFTALIASTGTILNYTEQLSHSFSNLSQRYLQIKHYYDFMALPEIVDDDSNETITDPQIVFKNVTFTYPKTGRAVLKDLSFDIKPGEHVALVGENGAGKSTVIKLLCKLYTPDSGEILINGKNIQCFSQKQLRQVFSVVFQDYPHYELTLRENIAFGDLSKIKNNKALHEALRQGMGEKILQASGKGLDMNLGKLEEDGIDLSAGQWQRIAIARACSSESAFIILDEPTASLDPIAESQMYTAFSQVLKNKGTIMISHRLASAKMADRIIVLDGGRTVETGSHIELMLKNGLYARMFSAQASWYSGEVHSFETGGEVS